MPLCPNNLTVWNPVNSGDTSTKSIFAGDQKSIVEALIKEGTRRGLGNLTVHLKEFILNESLTKEHLKKAYDTLLHIYNNPGLCNTFLKPVKLTPDIYTALSTEGMDINNDVENIKDLRNRINVLENDCMSHNTSHNTSHCPGYCTSYCTGYNTGHKTSHNTNHNTTYQTTHQTSHKIGHNISYNTNHCPSYNIMYKVSVVYNHNPAYQISVVSSVKSNHKTSVDLHNNDHGGGNSCGDN